jgi:hypothetical protein
MDAQTFDQWTAAIARRPNRRGALGLLAGGLLGGLLAHRGATPARARQRADRDDDGLYDDDETDVYGTNPDIYDTDGDGVGDGEEVYVGTDPLVNGNAAPAPAGGGGQPTGGPPAGGGGVGERPNATGCAVGLTLCSGFCVDLTNDFYNCGLCSNPCFGRDDPRTHCANNFCVYPCIQEGTC